MKAELNRRDAEIAGGYLQYEGENLAPKKAFLRVRGKDLLLSFP